MVAAFAAVSYAGDKSTTATKTKAASADAKTACRRHALADCLNKLFIKGMGLFIACVPFIVLIHQQFALELRIVELGVGVAHLACKDKAFKPFHKSLLA